MTLRETFLDIIKERNKLFIIDISTDLLPLPQHSKYNQMEKKEYLLIKLALFHLCEYSNLKISLLHSVQSSKNEAVVNFT